MQVFTTPDGKFKDTANRYKKVGEVIRISMPIEFEAKRYREIVYNKTFLGSMRKNIVGVIFVTEDGEYVSEARLKNELASLGYHFEVMLDDKSIKDLKSAITPELEIEKQLADYEQFNKALEVIKKSGILGTDNVTAILNKLPILKRENNKIIETYVNHLDTLNKENFVFNTLVYNELNGYYREILIKNFQRVKLVASGKKYYDDIKREATKRKRSITARFNTHDILMGITKLPYELDHLKSIVSVYERVADMKQDEYLKYLKSVEKTNINERIKLLR